MDSLKIKAVKYQIQKPLYNMNNYIKCTQSKPDWRFYKWNNGCWEMHSISYRKRKGELVKRMIKPQNQTLCSNKSKRDDVQELSLKHGTTV